MTEAKTLNRRDLLKLSGLAAASSVAGLMATNTHAGGHKKGEHDHHKMMHKAMDPKLKAVFETSNHCVASGQLCIQHCLEMFKMGDTSLAECAAVVEEAIAACDAVAQLAALRSTHLKPFVKACIDVCKACEKECKKHKDHPQCIDCGESCAECIKAYEAFLA